MFLEKVIKDVDCYLSTRQSVNSVLLFPPLNNWRRFLIHQTVCDSYASKHSLSSLSVGEGAGRRIALCHSSLIKEESKATPVKSSPAPIIFVPQQEFVSPFNLKRSPYSSASGATEKPAGREQHSTSSQLSRGEKGSLNTHLRKVARSNKGVMNIYTPPHLRKGNEMVNSGGGVGRGENEIRLLTSSENLERRCKTDPPTKINRTRRPDMKVYVPRALRSSLPSGTPNTPSPQVPVGHNARKSPVANSTNQTENKGTRNDLEYTFTKHTNSIGQPAREIITNNDKIIADKSAYTANENKYIPPPATANNLYNSDISPAKVDNLISNLPNNPIQNPLTNRSLHSNNSHLETTFNKCPSETITLVSQELGQEQNETLKILNNAEMRSDKKTCSSVDIEHVEHISNPKSEEIGAISENTHDTDTIAQTMTNCERNSLTVSARIEDDSKMEVDNNIMCVSENDDISTYNAEKNLTKENKFNTSDNVVVTVRDVHSSLVNIISSEEKNTIPSCSMDVEDGHISSIDQVSKEPIIISSKFETDVTKFTSPDSEYAVINVCGTHNEVPSKVRLVETNFHSNSITEKSSESLPFSAFNSNVKITSETTPDQEIDSKISDAFCNTSESLGSTMPCSNEGISALVECPVSSASLTPSEPSCSAVESPAKSLTPPTQSIPDSDSKLFESELESESPNESIAEFSQAESVSESSSSVSTPTKSMSQVSLNLPPSKLDAPVPSDVPSKAVPEDSLNVPSSPKSDIEISHSAPSSIESNAPISSNVPSPSKPVPEVSSLLSPPTTPVVSKQTNATAPVDLNPEECDWETLYDDDGECLVPDIMNQLMNKMGKVSVQTPTQEYRSYQTPEERTSDGENILEIYGFSSTLTNRDLMDVFAPYARTSFHIKWVDDTHALGVFASPLVADEVLNTNLPNVKTRPLREAIALSRAKAKTLLAAPCGPRPKTCLSSARRLVSGALGIRVQVSESKREEERQILKDAREKKRQEARQRQDIWGKD